VTGVVGVLGAAGAVGTATARALGAAGVRVRPGVRPAVDAGDPASLARFCAGCRVVVNATGAGERERVASAALAAGAHYVDPTGDAALVDRAKGATWTALLAAGATPGLSGLLPRWLASQGFDRASVLTAYAAAFDGFTPGAAAEFLLSLDGGDGEAGAAWRGGARAPGALRPVPRLELPFFDRPLAAFPYLSAETERVAGALGLDEVRWYQVFEADGRMHAALPRLRESLARGAALAGAAAELTRVAELDLFGRRPRQQLVLQLDGEAGGRPRSRVAVLDAAGTYELTGAVAALAVGAVLRGEAPAGAHLAADALDPAVVERLRGAPAVTGLHLLDGPLAAYAEVEQGAV